IMRMEAGLDTGPVAAMRALPIADEDTAGTLSEKLAALGAGLLGETLPAIADGRITLAPQDDARATLAPLLTKADGHLTFERPARPAPPVRKSSPGRQAAPALTARSLARTVLERVEVGGAYANRALSAALDRAPGMSAEDRGLATELVYGVLRRRGRIDRALN